jgi:hypothetical protein
MYLSLSAVKILFNPKASGFFNKIVAPPFILAKLLLNYYVFGSFFAKDFYFW